MKYEERITKVIILPEGEEIFSEHSTSIEIVDESGGEFLEVSQLDMKFRINPEEWKSIKHAIDKMIKQCRL